MKDRIARSVVWLIWSRGVLQVVTFVSTAVVARLLSPSDYGLFALAGVWIYALSQFADLGLGDAVVQYNDAGDRELNSCFWLSLAVGAVAAVAIWALAPATASLFATPALADALRVLSIAIPISAARVVPEGLLRRRLALDRLSQVNIAATLVSVPVVFCMAWRGFGAWALITGAMATVFVQNIGTFWFAAWRPGLSLGGSRFRQMVRYGSAALGARYCVMLSNTADTLVLGKVGGDVTVGVYSMAKQLAMLPVDKVAQVVNQIASPVMAGFQADRAALRASFLRGIRITTWLTLPMGVGLMLLGSDVVVLVLGAKWKSVTPTLYPLCAFAFVRSIEVLLTGALLARYRANSLLYYQLLLLAVMPVTFWVGSVLGGALGVAVAWVTVYPIVVLWMAREALLEVGASWRALAAEIWPPAVATLALTCAVLVARWTLALWSGGSVLLRLAITATAAGAAYGAVLLRLGGPLRGEIRQVTGWLFRGSPPLQAAE